MKAPIPAYGPGTTVSATVSTHKNISEELTVIDSKLPNGTSAISIEENKTFEEIHHKVGRALVGLSDTVRAAVGSRVNVFTGHDPRLDFVPTSKYSAPLWAPAMIIKSAVAYLDPQGDSFKAASAIFNETIKEATSAWKKTPVPAHYQRAVNASRADILSQEEERYLVERALSEDTVYYARKQNKTLQTRIALCSSGGGYRAMLSALGLYAGLENAGLYQKIDYNFGLSGGSWAALGVNQSKVGPAEYKKQLFKKEGAHRFLSNPLLPGGYDRLADINSLLTEIVRNNALYKDRVTLVSPWGAAIAKRIFLNYDPRTDYIMGNTPNTNYPFVVTTAVTPKKDFHNQQQAQQGQPIGQWSPENHYWLEFSHDQVSFVDLPDKSKARIPAMAFGRQFDDNGRSTDTPLPHTLAFGVGLYGSAMNVSTEELHQMGGYKPVAKLLKPAANRAHAAESDQKENQENHETLVFNLTNNILQIASNYTLQNYNFALFENKRVLAAQVSNWARNADARNPKTLTLVDAGVAFNLPLPPALNPARNIDVIIMNDGSSDIPVVGANELRKTLLYARAMHGFTYELMTNNQPPVKAADALEEADKEDAAAQAQEGAIDIYTENVMTTQFIKNHLRKNDTSMMVFKPTANSAQNAPLIIYFTVIDPTTEEQIDFGPDKFDYSNEDVHKLYDLMYSKVNKEAIETVINDFMEEREKRKQARPAPADHQANKKVAAGAPEPEIDEQALAEEIALNVRAAD